MDYLSAGSEISALVAGFMNNAVSAHQVVCRALHECAVSLGRAFGERMMRKLFLATMAFIAVASIWMAAAPVLARDYPFCIKGQGYITPTGDCSFDTYEQCLATASGRRNYCDVNPYFHDPSKSYVTRPKKRSRSH
jgi:uncharacterized protein DUF3551